MNNIELNAILFYADYMSLRDTCIPVTDNCKYFYIHGTPINAAFILNLEPEYDETSPYFTQALMEYTVIRDKYDNDALQSFIDDICAIRACGSVNAELMLTRIHQFSDKKTRKLAFSKYREWKNNQYYSHLIINDDGDIQERLCTKYVSHTERMLDRLGIFSRTKKNGTNAEKLPENAPV